jgi:hypothetical protein
VGFLSSIHFLQTTAKKVFEIYDSVINELNDARCYDDDKDDLSE